jgi:DnaJ-class molecular chaperone
VSLIEEDRGSTRTTPLCNCCQGSGEHEHRPYITASPYDTTGECTTCAGTGLSWHNARPNGCTGYRELMRRNR